WPLLLVSCRGRYLKPPICMLDPRSTVNACGSGATAVRHCVCQIVGKPSTAFDGGESDSYESALTTHPARDSVVPLASSRLNSAIVVNWLPFTSLTASSFTYFPVGATAVAVTVQVK